MEKEIKTAILTDEDGKEYELEVIKEFDYKDKHYAVLYDEYDECDEEECECNDECDEECTCGCHHDEEEDERIYILEVNKDENGKDTYNEVSEDLMQELIPVVEKELYPTEE
jgi:uncharacterized protein YrzB (UPF0473 family)